MLTTIISSAWFGRLAILLIDTLVKYGKLSDEDKQYLQNSSQIIRARHLKLATSRIDLEDKIKEQEDLWEKINNGEAKRPWDESTE